MKKAGHFICNLFEILRYLSVFIGILIANHRQLPQERLATITIFFILGLNGLSGLEGYFWGKYSSEISGYKDPGSYQKQSAINNLALAFTTIIVYILNWGTVSQLTLLTVMILFFTMSGLNHAIDTLKYGNRNIRNYLRPVMSIVLLIIVLYFMFPVICLHQS